MNQMLLSPFHSHEEEDRREAARLERGWGEGVRQVGKTHSVTEFISQNYRHHILHRPMKNERARSAFDGDPTVDISSIDRLNGMFG